MGNRQRKTPGRDVETQAVSLWIKSFADRPCSARSRTVRPVARQALGMGCTRSVRACPGSKRTGAPSGLRDLCSKVGPPLWRWEDLFGGLGGTVKSHRSGGAAPRIVPVRGRLFLPLVLVGVAGLSLGLAGCGSSSPSSSYQRGWDRAVNSPGYDCNTVPRDIASASDWTKGCLTAENFQKIRNAKGRPTPTPTTYSGDP